MEKSRRPDISKARVVIVVLLVLGTIVAVSMALFIVWRTSGPLGPDLAAVKFRRGDLSPKKTNCEALTLALRANEGLFIHGWESFGSEEKGEVFFWAGRAQYPTDELLVLAWRIEGDQTTYLSSPESAVAALRALRRKDPYGGGPTTHMEPFDPKWDLCHFENVDWYHGIGEGPDRQDFPSVDRDGFEKESRRWTAALELPAVNLLSALNAPDTPDAPGE